MKTSLTLVRPQTQYEASFRAAFAELTNDSDRAAWIYLGDADYPSYFVQSFAAYVHTLLERETNPPSHFVCDTIYWVILNNEVVGRISLRHELNDFLAKVGGHIGYIVRPSSRGQGVATEILRQLLLTEKAKSIGKLLLTCDATNTASEKTILKCGGKLERIVEIEAGKPLKKRFWITLNSSAIHRPDAPPDQS